MRIRNFKKVVYLISVLSICSCTPKVTRLQSQFASINQQDPALSGNGEKLALIVDYQGRPSVELRDLRNGKVLPLRHLSRNQPHSSPSLSWNGRYIAVIVQRGVRRLVIIEDRLTGRSHQIPMSGERIPVRLSLAPDASQLALQITDKGKWRIELFDLSGKIEPDQPIGRGLLNDSGGLN